MNFLKKLFGKKQSENPSSPPPISFDEMDRIINLVDGNSPTVEITQSDVDAIREYKRHLAKKWWKTELREQAFCDHCQSPVPRDTGYLIADGYLYCESCGDKHFGPDALANLRRSPSYFGSGVLKEARTFVSTVEKH